MPPGTELRGLFSISLIIFCSKTLPSYTIKFLHFLQSFLQTRFLQILNFPFFPGKKTSLPVQEQHARFFDFWTVNQQSKMHPWALLYINDRSGPHSPPWCWVPGSLSRAGWYRCTDINSYTFIPLFILASCIKAFALLSPLRVQLQIVSCWHRVDCLTWVSSSQLYPGCDTWPYNNFPADSPSSQSHTQGL